MKKKKIILKLTIVFLCHYHYSCGVDFTILLHLECLKKLSLSLLFSYHVWCEWALLIKGH